MHSADPSTPKLFLPSHYIFKAWAGSFPHPVSSQVYTEIWFIKSDFHLLPGIPVTTSKGDLILSTSHATPPVPQLLAWAEEQPCCNSWCRKTHHSLLHSHSLPGPKFWGVQLHQIVVTPPQTASLLPFPLARSSAVVFINGDLPPTKLQNLCSHFCCCITERKRNQNKKKMSSRRMVIAFVVSCYSMSA